MNFNDDKLLKKISITGLSIGMGLITISSIISPYNDASVNTIIAGYSLVGASILFLFGVNFKNSDVFAMNMHPGISISNIIYILKQIISFIERAAPYLAVLSMVGWMIAIIVMNTSALAHNEVAPIFYTYFFVSYLCLLLETVTLSQLKPDTIQSRTNESYMSSLILLFATLNVFGNLIIQIILTDYTTQG